MLSEALEKLVELTRAGREMQIVKPDREPDHVYYTVNAAGTITRVEGEPKPRAHTAMDLQTVVDFAKEFAGSPGLDPEGDPLLPNRVAIWYSRSGVTALLDDDTRRDRVHMPIRLHSQVMLLSNLESQKPWYTQPEFIRLLRISLSGTLPSPDLVAACRRVKFRQAADGQREVQHGKASIGKQIETELTGTATWPEEIRLHVPLFDGLFFHSNVNCAIEIEPTAEKFQLLPFPGEVELAVRYGEEQLGERLKELIEAAGDETVENTCLFYGTP